MEDADVRDRTSDSLVACVVWLWGGRSHPFVKHSLHTHNDESEKERVNTKENIKALYIRSIYYCLRLHYFGGC
jgi:hypothetical protein